MISIVAKKECELEDGEGSYECVVCYQSCQTQEKPLSCSKCCSTRRIHAKCALLPRNCPQCRIELQDEVPPWTQQNLSEIVDIDSEKDPSLSHPNQAGTEDNGGEMGAGSPAGAWRHVASPRCLRAVRRGARKAHISPNGRQRQSYARCQQQRQR